MPYVPAGKLRHRVTIERAAESHVQGEVTKKWEALATVWALIEPLTTREYLALASMHDQVSHRVVIRRRSDLAITGAMRIRYGSRIFELVGPPRNLDEADRVLELICRETR